MPTATLEAPADTEDHPDWCVRCTIGKPTNPDEGHPRHRSEVLEGHPKSGGWYTLQVEQIPGQAETAVLTTCGTTLRLTVGTDLDELAAAVAKLIDQVWAARTQQLEQLADETLASDPVDASR